MAGGAVGLVLTGAVLVEPGAVLVVEEGTDDDAMTMK